MLSSSFFARVARTPLVRSLCLGVSLALVCGGLGGCLSSEPSIGVVDSATVVQDGKPGRAALAHLAHVRQVLQNNLDAVVKKLESYPDKKQAQEILLASQEALQQTLDAHESQINAQLTELLQASVRECRAAKELTAVVSKDTLLDYNPALNITPEVLALFDKKDVRFPLAPETVTDPQLPAPLKPAAAARPVVEEKKAAVESKPVPRAEPRRRAPKKDDKRRN